MKVSFGVIYVCDYDLLGFNKELWYFLGSLFSLFSFDMYSGVLIVKNDFVV